MVSAPRTPVLNGPVIVLTGTTASGKTSASLDFARKYGPIEIINADSLLVYRGMDIGTAKPGQKERDGIPHHLIDFKDPNDPFSAGDFVRETESALSDICSRGKIPLIVGGTGFYLKALFFGLWESGKADPVIREKLEKYSNQELYERLEKIDSVSALRMGVNDRYRLIRALEIFELSGKTPTELQSKQSRNPNPDFQLWVLDRPNSELYERISQRSRDMLNSGFIDEVKTLMQRYPQSRALSAVGYEEVKKYLKGEKPQGRTVPEGMPGLTQEIELATRQLVKKQRTWFRGQKYAKWFILERDRVALKQAFDAAITPWLNPGNLKK
ncbi:MAG: tRNA (adenosine(37)-N6)-dimethylallyltransferase MiaA [Bdellovibrionota bacterium]